MWDKNFFKCSILKFNTNIFLFNLLFKLFLSTDSLYFSVHFLLKLSKCFQIYSCKKLTNEAFTNIIMSSTTNIQNFTTTIKNLIEFLTKHTIKWDELIIFK